MDVFKICSEKYAHSLMASGAANRWNKKDQFVIYTGGSRSLSTLETVAHRSAINLSSPYKLLTITITDLSSIQEINQENLPDNWKSIDAYVELQEIGSKWYNSMESLVLKVPSALITQEFNYIINTNHPLFSANIILKNVEDFVWDIRLL
ncbi:MAG: RES family NAD+ phosphorylase [Prolixibacteraceae bacterium]|nr:RES family NAD+ phosphorylase [Prolixibacteraceae bacterium]